jgi:hypothetical protein
MFISFHFIHHPTEPATPDIPSDRVEGILTRMMDVFRGGILADWYE